MAVPRLAVPCLAVPRLTVPHLAVPRLAVPRLAAAEQQKASCFSPLSDCYAHASYMQILTCQSGHTATFSERCSQV